jgi:chorismate lyase/3-hydroxybenzoate synthase
MVESARALAAAATPRIEYAANDPAASFPADALCGVVFGDGTAYADPRCVRVGLKPLRGAPTIELWHSQGAAHLAFDGPVRFACDAHHLAGAIELDERECGGLAGATKIAYQTLQRFMAKSVHPHLLRVWNYFDDINGGSGDDERYKQFCAGRAASWDRQPHSAFPAATAIGRRDGKPVLQVYWLAGRDPGIALENPRQISAYRYPRKYGPAAPRFSRAMLVSERLVMISGTASIVGHSSHHQGNLEAQIDETLRNVTSVLQRAAAHSPALSPRLGPSSLLKVYLRRAQDADAAEALLRTRLPAATRYLMLEADICRADLLVEVDCLHGA